MLTYHTLMIPLALFIWLPLPVLSVPMDGTDDITHDEWNELSHILQDGPSSPYTSIPYMHQAAMVELTRQKRKRPDSFNENLFCQPCRDQWTVTDSYHCVAEPSADSESEMNDNDETVHGNDARPHICKVQTCGKAFKSKCNLSWHIKSTHSNDRPFKCTEPECGKAFKDRGSLVRHGKTVHTDERPYPCDVTGCGKAFKSRGNLVEHGQIHSRDRLYSCKVDGCGEMFKSRGNLVEHGQIHSPDRLYSCKVDGCGEMFSIKSDAVQHRRSHRPSRTYSCTEPGCEKTFKTHSGLWQHRPFHTGERRYKCEEPGCGKAFKQKNSLKNHAYKSHEQVSSVGYSVFAEICVDAFKKPFIKSKFKRANLTSRITDISEGIIFIMSDYKFRYQRRSDFLSNRVKADIEYRKHK
jgi:uncharacterized Zn-finger protein